MTIAAMLAGRASQPVWYVEIEGVPLYQSGVLSNVIARFATRIGTGPGWSAQWVPCLHDIPTGLDESVDLLRGVTRMGATTITLQEYASNGTPPAVIPNVFTHLFSWGGGVAQPRTNLTATLTAGGTSIAVTSTSNLSANKAIWIGREALYVSLVTSGTTANVVRGAFNTRAVAHSVSTSTESHDDGVYTHPPLIIGRRAVVYLTDLTLDPTDAANVAVVFSGIVDAVGHDKTGVWSLSCRNDIARMDGDLCRNVFTGEVVGPLERRRVWVGLRSGFGPSQVEGDDVLSPIYEGGQIIVQLAAGSAPFQLGGLDDRGVLKIGNELVEVLAFSRTTFADSDAKHTGFVIQKRALFQPAGAPLTAISLGDRAVQVWPSEPDTELYGDADTAQAFGYWTGGAFVPNAAPAIVSLNLIISTGSATQTAGGANTTGARNYDTLPFGMGLAVPVAQVDVASFEATTNLAGGSRLSSVSMPAFLFGAKAEPWNAKTWLDKHVFGPTGTFVYVAAGLLTLGIDEDAYEFDTFTAIAEADAVASEWYDYDPNAGAQIGTDEFKATTASGGEVTIPINSVLVRERRVVSDRAETFDATGLRLDGGAIPGLVASRGTFIVQRHDLPRPRLTLRLAWQHAAFSLGTKCSIDLGLIPNALTGAVGWASTDGGWISVSKRAIPLRGLVEVTFEFQSELRKHVGFSATVTTWVGGTKMASFSDPNTYTTGTATGSVPANDTDVVSVGDYVCIRDKRGALKSDNAVTVASKTATNIVTSAAFTLGGVAYTRVDGDVMTFAPYGDGTNTTSHERQFAYLADAATAMIGSSTVAADKYGA